MANDEIPGSFMRAMEKERKITTAIAIVLTLVVSLTLSAIGIMEIGKFKQGEKVYCNVAYDLDEETGFVITSVEGRRLSIDVDKIVSLPSDCDSGNILYVSEYKTSFFTKTVYEVKRFVIIIPTEGH